METVRDTGSESRFSAEKMQKINLFETPNFFCDVYCLEPGQEQKPHTHSDADKVYHVLEGEGSFLIGRVEHRLSAGQIVLAAAGDEHGVRNDSNSRLRILVFMTPNPNFRKQG